MMAKDVDGLAGAKRARHSECPGYRYGQTRSRIGFHGGKVEP